MNNDVGVTKGIIISVSDGLETVSLPAFDITVSNINDVPVISGIPSTKVIQDTFYIFTPDASDADGDTLTFSIVNKPSWAIFDTATGTLSGTPGNADVGVTSGIIISVSDGLETASLPAFDITVSNTNDKPVISGIPLTKVIQDTLYNFTPDASDADGDILTFSIENKPSWAVFDTANGVLTGTPGNEDVGVTNGIIISISDGLETASLPAFDITVENVNYAPVISGIPSTKVLQDTFYIFTPTATDADGDILTFSIVNKPSWAVFDTANGTLSGIPGNNDVGVTKGIIISVSDGLETVSLPAFDITVANVNDKPVISGIPSTKVIQDTFYIFTPDASDADGDILTFSIVNKPSWAVFDTANGTLSGTPGNADVGITNGIIISTFRRTGIRQFTGF